jgi:hypothetical protein
MEDSNIDTVPMRRAEDFSVVEVWWLRGFRRGVLQPDTSGRYKMHRPPVKRFYEKAA